MKLGWLRARLPGNSGLPECNLSCRHCGTTVECGTDSCPACGRTGNATYEFG